MKNFFFILSAAILFASCRSKNDYDLKSDKTYEKTKESLEEKEKKNPAAFLTVTGNDKKNILGQTVIKGKIFNNAKIATYKDVELKLRFYSKTGALLEEDIETVYDNITPGSTKSFKSKYFTPKGTDSVSLIVVGAKF